MKNMVIALLILSILFVFGCTTTQDPEPVESPSGSFYKSFTIEEFELAKASGKTIFLEFHANWCSVCRDQEVELEAAFSDPALPEGIAGFRVNYRDGATDKDEENLARTHGITYQYSKVIIGPDGTVLLKEVATPWGKKEIIDKLRYFSS